MLERQVCLYAYWWMLERQMSCGVRWTWVEVMISEIIHVVFAVLSEEGSLWVCNNSILCVERPRWVHKRYSGFSGKLKSKADLHCIAVGWECPLSVSFVKRGSDWAPCEVGMCYQVLLFGRHTWGGRKCGGAARARVRCDWAKFKELSPILTAQGASYRTKRKIQGLCPYCIDMIWDWNLGDEESKSPKSIEDGTHYT